MDLPVPSYTTVRWTEELPQVIDPELQAFTAADRKLMGAFGNTIKTKTPAHRSMGRVAALWTGAGNASMAGSRLESPVSMI